MKFLTKIVFTFFKEKKMKEWLKDAIFYEIYPQSFKDTNGDGIGDLSGVIEKLDYIKDLAKKFRHLTPIKC